MRLHGHRPMTKDQAIEKAAARFDALYNDSIRKLVSDMIWAGRDDDEIAEMVAVAIEQHDEARAIFVQNVRSSLDEHFPVTH